MKYEFVDVKKPSTVDYTRDDMSMDVNKVLYAAVRPHQETVKIKTDQDPSVTSSISGTKDQQVYNIIIIHVAFTSCCGPEAKENCGSTTCSTTCSTTYTTYT